jgi:hypothetical protein
MHIRNSTQKKKLTYLFAAFYGLACTLLVLVLTVFWNNPGPEQNSSTADLFQIGNLKLQRANDLLSNHLQKLQALDQRYVSLLSSPVLNPGLDSASSEIKKAEREFRQEIDSVDKAAAKDNEIAKFNQTLSYFKSCLESRRYSDNMQVFVAGASRQLAEVRGQMDTLKKLLLEKDSSIAEMKTQTGSGYQNKNESAISRTDYQLLKSENRYLKSQLDVLEPQPAPHYTQVTTTNRKSKSNIGVDLKDPSRAGR